MASNIVQLSETNGSVGSPTISDNIANINFGSVDATAIVPNSHKIIIGQNSFMKWIRFKLVTNNNTSDSNFRVTIDNPTPATGAFLIGNVNTANKAVMGLGTPRYGYDINGNPISPFPTNGNAYGTWFGNTIPSNLEPPTSLPSSNLSVGTTYGSGGALTANGTYTDYSACQLVTGNTTPAAPVSTMTWTFTYDEV